MKPAGMLGSLLLLLLLTGAILAHSPSQGYDLSWWTVDGGGGMASAGGGYSLGGTAGQPDAGLLGDETYTLGGGFWKGGMPGPPPHRIYLPMVLRQG